MNTPLVRIGPHIITSLRGDVDDATVMQLQEDLARDLEATKTQGVMLDVSGLEIVDSFIARALANTVQLTRLMGAEAVIVGIQPAVALTLSDMGLSLPGIHTALNAAKGMEMLNKLEGGQP